MMTKRSRFSWKAIHGEFLGQAIYLTRSATELYNSHSKNGIYCFHAGELRDKLVAEAKSTIGKVADIGGLNPSDERALFSKDLDLNKAFYAYIFNALAGGNAELKSKFVSAGLHTSDFGDSVLVAGKHLKDAGYIFKNGQAFRPETPANG